MKKFCSTCGNQLELSQRFCAECGTVNPFFVPAFTLLSDQSQSLEKLRIEKERIEKELHVKEDEQREFQKQEELRKQIASAEKLRNEQLEQERIQQEKEERERVEANLKNEILRVKEEALQYKEETIGLLREVRKEVKDEIQQIDEQNKRLKQEVEILSKQKSEVVMPPANLHDEAEEPVTPPEQRMAESRNNQTALRAVLGVVLLLAAFLVYFYFFQIKNETDTPLVSEAVAVEEIPASPVQETENVADTLVGAPALNEVAEPVAAEGNTIVSKPTVEKASIAPKTKITDEPVPEKNTPVKMVINENRVGKDLYGKRISGCGVTIGAGAEIKQISNLVLVEKTTEYTKYRCKVLITQGADIYTSSPYLYYSTEGELDRIDGSNCE